MRDVGESGWSLAPFSSRGPTADGRIKPDICAPGYRISAPRAGTADRYTVMSGTSMASPVVAGVAALLLEANPYLTVDEVKDTLFSTAQDWGAPGKDIDYGWGRLNAYRAVQRVLGLPGVGPSNPTHALGRGTIAEGQELWYRLNVTDAGMPIAATLLATDSIENYYDLDLYLYDEAGTELAVAQNVGREEIIIFQPVTRGKYFLKIHGFEGGGPFTLDASWR